ncbi:MAG TPA: ATP-binding protein [Leptolyngbyaceae cyanobacterium M65_K2018_010]|nr:ATP-binding protein [Leptolyngbyaceae cyanobacterium M65_K2018_010]
MVSSSSQDNPTPAAELETLRLLNQLSELDRLSAWVAELSGRLGLSPRRTFQLDLVLAEAVTNIIENAYTDGAVHEINLAIDPTPPRLQIQIRDDGLPFNPLDHPEVVQPQSLDEAQVGGLGIHLIRSYAQECRYERQGNENWFTILLPRTD